MNRLLSNRLTVRILVVAVSVLLPCAGRMQGAGHRGAMSIPGGTISTTLAIYQDSELTGDVNCAVPLTSPGANPCISFGADHIKLRLNGHTITGPVTPPTGCSLPTDANYGVGIEAIDRSDVEIDGPGIIQYFERWGILLGLAGHRAARSL
jgi:hypothetical protein